jgi:hypothetical protein
VRFTCMARYRYPRDARTFKVENVRELSGRRVRLKLLTIGSYSPF